MSSTAAPTDAERWAEELAGWAIPEHILAAAPEPPWGFPTEIWERAARSIAADPAARTPTGQSALRALEALEPLAGEGTVLDVGVGAGAASLPLAGRTSLITGVDEGEGMLEAFQRLAAEHGIVTRAVLGRWPDVAPRVEPADVVVCNHVLYNVPDIEAFVSGLDGHARRRVVIELTSRHPLTNMAPLWRDMHGIERPLGPTAEDALTVIRNLGIPARAEVSVRLVDHDEKDRLARVALARRRLCVGPERDAEIAALLPEDDRDILTIWWDKSS